VNLLFDGEVLVEGAILIAHCELRKMVRWKPGLDGSGILRHRRILMDPRPLVAALDRLAACTRAM